MSHELLRTVHRAYRAYRIPRRLKGAMLSDGAFPASLLPHPPSTHPHTSLEPGPSHRAARLSPMQCGAEGRQGREGSRDEHRELRRGARQRRRAVQALHHRDPRGVQPPQVQEVQAVVQRVQRVRQRRPAVEGGVRPPIGNEEEDQDLQGQYCGYPKCKFIHFT